MNGRTTSEIVADLRDVAFEWNHTREAIRIIEAADHLHTIDAHRLPCSTCGGNRIVLVINAPGGESFEAACPENGGNCDGRMSHEQAWKIVAAVFDDELVDGDMLDVTTMRCIR